MKIGFGYKNHRGIFLYWKSSLEAQKWDWLFIRVMRRCPVSYGQFENGFRIL